MYGVEVETAAGLILHYVGDYSPELKNGCLVIDNTDCIVIIPTHNLKSAVVSELTDDDETDTLDQ